MPSTATPPLTDDHALLREAVVYHLTFEERDPRDTSLNQLIREMATCLVWDMDDNATLAYLTQHQNTLIRLLSEYAEVWRQRETNITSPLRDAYQAIETNVACDITHFHYGTS